MTSWHYASEAQELSLEFVVSLFVFGCVLVLWLFGFFLSGWFLGLFAS